MEKTRSMAREAHGHGEYRQKTRSMAGRCAVMEKTRSMAREARGHGENTQYG